MNKAWISIGSNEDSKTNMELSRSMLAERFRKILFTREMETAPYGKQYKGMFLNQFAVAFTEHRIAKEIELSLGRLPEHKAQGIVKMDIDVFGWNGEIVRPHDYNRPYVQDLLPQLAELLKE